MSARMRPIGFAVLALGFLCLCVASLSGDWSSFFSRDAAARMLEFAAGFYPPALGWDFLAKVSWAAAETLAISWLGTLLAALGGLVLALPASGRWGAPARAMARLALNMLRSVPELVWAAIVVIAAGLGPFAGTLALALHTTGVLGRLFGEALENVPPEPYLSLRRHGCAALPAFWYATFPQVLPQLMSYTLYRWENNIRAAAVLGVVGAGGLGQMLYFHLSLFHMRETATVLIAMVLLVTLVDVTSNRLRIRMTA